MQMNTQDMGGMLGEQVQPFDVGGTLPSNWGNSSDGKGKLAGYSPHWVAEKLLKFQGLLFWGRLSQDLSAVKVKILDESPG